jgi:hypothetical protein
MNRAGSVVAQVGQVFIKIACRLSNDSLDLDIGRDDIVREAVLCEDQCQFLYAGWKYG